MCAQERPTLEVGRIIKAHGLKGQVIVDLWSDFEERVAPGSVLTTDRGELAVIASTAHQDRYIVTFDRITSREDADAWRGVVLRAQRLDRDDVLWIDELFGAQVFDRSGTNRGVVVDVEANPASDIMVLDTGALVPLTFVTSVRANERIDVDDPEGLFE